MCSMNLKKLWRTKNCDEVVITGTSKNKRVCHTPVLYALGFIDKLMFQAFAMEKENINCVTTVS